MARVRANDNYTLFVDGVAWGSGNGSWSGQDAEHAFRLDKPAGPSNPPLHSGRDIAVLLTPSLHPTLDMISQFS